MSMSEDELEVAMLAASVSGQLKHVDSSMVNGNNTNGPANKIDPRSFLPKNARIPTPRQQVNIPGMMQQPVSRPMGAEDAGTVQVNMADLIIPMDGLDAETRKLIAQHERATAPTDRPPVQQAVSENRLGPAPGTIEAQIKSQPGQTYIKEVIKEVETDSEKAYQYIKRKMKILERKLDLIMTKLEIKLDGQV